MSDIDALPDVMNHSRAIHPAVALSLISPIQLLRRKEFKGSQKLTRPELHHVCRCVLLFIPLLLMSILL